MKISQLIEELSQLQTAHGDLVVKIPSYTGQVYDLVYKELPVVKVFKEDTQVGSYICIDVEE